MKALADRIRQVTADCREVGHPLDLNHLLEPEYLKAAREVSAARALDEPIPKLCTQVVASPFDAAIHDAFGKVHGRNVYATYGPDLLPGDLSRYLGRDFRGERLLLVHLREFIEGLLLLVEGLLGLDVLLLVFEVLLLRGRPGIGDVDLAEDRDVARLAAVRVVAHGRRRGRLLRGLGGLGGLRRFGRRRLGFFLLVLGR